MTPEELRQHAAWILQTGGLSQLQSPQELATWLEEVAEAMEAPMEVTRLDARPRKSGRGSINLRGPADSVVAAGRRGVLYRRVALLLVEEEAP